VLIMQRGAGLVAAIAARAPFTRAHPEQLSKAARIDALVALEQLKSWVDAQQLRLLAVMAAGDEFDRDLAAAEVGVALCQPPATVHGRMQLADELVRRLPATLELLHSGAITVRHAQAVAEGVRPLPDALALQVERRVLDRAGEQSVAALRRSVARAVLVVDPRSAEERHRAARADRRVCLRPVADGMAQLWALLPADGAATVMTTLNAMAAAKASEDTRTMDQRRADALVDLAGARLSAAPLPKQHGRRPAIQVTVAASTLLGLDEKPAELGGYGAIPASLARQLAADPTGTWRRLITDPSSGTLLDYGRTTYRPPQPLADHVAARDQVCRFPGCRQPARRCDIDHQVPFPEGPTAADNLEFLCEHHHGFKHRGGWTVRGDPNGVLIWTSPTGHEYRSSPHDYG
jgi:hypothetical protein